MTNKKIFLFLILILGTIVFTYGKNLKRVSADEEITICPLSKMVTVGSLLDQSLISINNLLLEADIILTNSSQVYQSASDLIKIGEEDCVPENCQSSCELAARPWPPLTSCTYGYTCSDPNILPGSDWTVSQINCVSLPSGPIIIDPQRYYGVFYWRGNQSYQCNPFACPAQYAWCSNHGSEALVVPYDVYSWEECLDWCNQNMNSSQPLCQKNEGERNCWIHYPPANGVSNCDWQYTYPTSPFGALWNNSGGTCYDTCYDEGNCSVDWTTCAPGTCGGEACPFALITSIVDNVAANITAIEEAHQKIKDFFEKSITQFPKPDNYTIFGEFYKHYILSKICWMGSCESEFYALAGLQDKARTAIQKCDIIKPDDLFTEKQGEILFRCEDVRPSPIEQCWQDDFFCCASEEPK